MKNILSKTKSRIHNILFRPHAIYRPIKNDENIVSVSNYFFYRNDDFKTLHILENPAFIHNCAETEVVIRLTFHDRYGKVCHHKDYRFSSREKLIDFSDFKASLDEYGGFWLSLIENKNSNLPFIHHFRGYTGYSRSSTDPKFYSYVHGNFGALFLKNEKTHSLTRRSTKNFYYTPQVEIGRQQDFFFVNPYEVAMETTMMINSANGSQKVGELKLPPFGAGVLSAPKGKWPGTTATFACKSPVNRPIVFEYYDNQAFDVLHT